MMKICETILADTLADLRRARDAARDADLVELRLDGLRADELDVAGALAGRRAPVVVTCRPVWEGGAFAGGEEERLRVLTDAVRLGAEYVDVEWKADWRRVASAGQAPIVLSHHDFEGVPGDLAGRVRAMRACGAPVIKIAVRAHRLRDCLALRDAMGRGGDHVAIAMGSAGALTRVLPSRFGSCWTYAGAAAPGQRSADELRRRYRVHTVSATTRVFGIAGAPLDHSASPAMHNAACVAAGLDGVYAPFETADPDELLEVAGALGVEGLSVTAPLKTALVDRCAPDAEARAIGAVNTLRRHGASWEGRNFDAPAFLAPLESRGLLHQIHRGVVLGAGGAARAAAQAFRARGIEVAISARDAARAHALARAIGGEVAAWPPEGTWDVLVNATPVGTAPHLTESPIARADLHAAIVYDLVYNPKDTALLRFARETGATPIGGLEMLVHQGQRQFEWWTGATAEAAVFAHAASAFIDDSERTTSAP